MLQSLGRLVLLVSVIGGLVACGSAAKPGETSGPSASANETIEIPVAGETAPVAGSQPNDAAIWLHPTDPSKSVILGASGEGGIEIYSLRGERLSAFTDVHADFIDILPTFHLQQGPQPLIVAYDNRQAGLAAFTLDPASLAITRVSTNGLQTGSEVTGLCAYHSPRTGRHYVFAATDDGFLQQWELLEESGRVEGAITRSLPFGAGAGYCAVDRLNATVYVAEESVGIWKLSAEPESDPQRELLDLVGPRGHLAEEVKGVAFVPSGGDSGYLLAADVGAARVNVYSTNDRKYIGSFSSKLPPESEALKETEGLVVTTANLGTALPAGLLVLADKTAGAPTSSYRLLSWQQIASALKLDPAPASSHDAATTQSRNVMPSVETDPVDDYGDAADDPAIWVHPTDPSKSLIIGAQKKRGLYVYDLSGKTLQVVPDGRMNNVDLRHGFRLGNEVVAIVAASNRTAHTLALYKLDAATRRLENIAAEPIPTGFDDPYGLCMYRDTKSGTFYVFMNDADSGAYKQWKLVPKGNRVAAELLREFTVGSQAEGCAADDESGALYIAEEDVGLWRYEADPSSADRRVAIDSTSGQGHLTPDVEGVAIYYGEKGTGYLIVSNQGKDNYAVYRREGRNEFLGHFSVIADSARGIDGASETDGLDVISTPLGPAFPYGLFVAQDGRNIAPAERQNFKLVPWERVADVMSLQKFTGWRPDATP